MKLKLKITKLLNSKDSIGDVFLEESKIGSFSFKSQRNGIYNRPKRKPLALAMGMNFGSSL